MAIRNNKLGGSDFVNGEVLYDYDLDDTNNALIDVAANGVAQNAYQTLKHAGTFDNKDNLGADRFTDENGVNNTVDIGSSTMLYNSVNNEYVLDIVNEASGDTTHNPDAFANPENAFDGDRSSQSNKSVNNDEISLVLGKTFPSKFIQYVRYRVRLDETEGAQMGKYISLQSYDGSIWNTEIVILNEPEEGIGQILENIINFNKSVQGLRILYDNTGAGRSYYAILYELQYGEFVSSGTLLCNQNLPTLTGNEKSICVYSDKVNTANTNITYNVSDGTTTINDLEFNTVNEITSLGSGQLEITFNLSTTDTSETPELYGYSYYIN